MLEAILTFVTTFTQNLHSFLKSRKGKTVTETGHFFHKFSVFQKKHKFAHLDRIGKAKANSAYRASVWKNTTLLLGSTRDLNIGSAQAHARNVSLVMRSYDASALHL